MWQKLIWPWRPESNREAGSGIVANFLLHWFPNRVSLRSLAFSASLYLGTITFIPRHHHLHRVPGPDGDRGGVDVFVHSVSRTRLLEHQGPRQHCELRMAPQTAAPDLRPPHGGAGLPPHVPGLSHRLLQGRRDRSVGAPLQLGAWCHTAGADAAPQLHRLPPALGPARLLGDHGGNQHRSRCSSRWRGHTTVLARRHDHRPTNPHSVLRPPLCAPADRALRGGGVAHVADPQGRRPRHRRAGP